MMWRSDTYRWVPWAFAGALSAVVVVNGALAYFALESSTGLVTEHPFESGVDYNRVLDSAAAQDALGWQGRVEVAAVADAQRNLTAELVDRAGRPLLGLSVSARLVRPVEPLPDIVVPLQEVGGGIYAATTALSRPGQWQIRVVARQGSAFFQFERRIVVK